MIISFETSSSDFSITLMDKDEIINYTSIPIKNELSEIIVPAIKMFLQDNFISLSDISFLVVGCGPGSFTGIRAAISTALGITSSNKHIKSIGINSLAGIAMSVLNEANNLKLKYIISSINSKNDDLFLQVYKINNIKSLPFFAISDIDTLKVENLYNYFLINNITLKDILFVGHQSNMAKNLINNLHVSKNSKQYPDALWVGKLASYIIRNKINVKKTSFAFNKFKPIYVRPAQVNIK